MASATCIASDHLWSMVRQSVASKCVYTSATWGAPIHIYLSVPGVQKQYIGLNNWMTLVSCMYMGHPSSLIQVHSNNFPSMAYISINSLINTLIFLKQHLIRFLSQKYFIWKLKKKTDFQKIWNLKQTQLGLFNKKNTFLPSEWG